MRTCGLYACAFYCNGHCTGDDKFYEYSQCIYKDSPLIETSDATLWGQPFKFGPIIGIGCPPKTRGIDGNLVEGKAMDMPSGKTYFMDF